MLGLELGYAVIGQMLTGAEHGGEFSKFCELWQDFSKGKCGVYATLRLSNKHNVWIA